MSKSPIQIRRAGGVGASVLLCLTAFSAPTWAAKTPCLVTAGNVASLQACINTADTLGGSRTDTVVVTVPAGTYQGQQIRINRKRNLWIVGDTSLAEASQARILYQDRQHVYTDLDSTKRADTSSTGIYGQNNGTVWIYHSDNIRLMGLLIDGDSSTSATSPSKTNTAARIFAYGASLGKGAPVEIRGNVGVNILESRNVQLRYLSITNAWNGISIIAPNFGGAFAFPDPNDPIQEVVRTLPTSQAGLYGNHLIERCRIHDNVFGILFQRDWDLSSVVRNNLIWNNYLRHWGQGGATTCPSVAEYISGLCKLDTGVRADGSRRSLAYTTVGGAFLMTDVALTPYRIHNNTFFKNATTFSGYYKTGTQHLFYNNLVGRPYQSFRGAANLNVSLWDSDKAWHPDYTQTERNSEMLQFFSEHQRSNRVVDQDSVLKAADQAYPVNPWGSGGDNPPNLRLFNMRQSRAITSDYSNWRNNSRSWSNQSGDNDSVTMSWVPDVASPGTIASIADTGGIVSYIRHNMWAGSAADPGESGTSPTRIQDPQAANWAPPWIPRQIRRNLTDPTVFRNTGAFDVRWTFRLPINDGSGPAAGTWLQPVDTTPSHVSLVGWPTYEGTATAGEATKAPLSIGAFDATTRSKWAAPARRLVLRDTLIESVTDSMVKFNLNVSGEGLANEDIDSLFVSSAKFYNDVPVSDTLYNQGPVTPGSTLTTTRINSVLSSKPWPLPYQFVRTDYDRAGYSVDDTLSKKLLAPDNTFLARIGAGKRLDADSLYARAEVVLKAKLKDGTYVYSNPGVFMFSRPRFQFMVTATDMDGKPLPMDPDGISQDVNAGQPFKVVVKAKVVATLPVPFKGYANLQIGNLGSLPGTDMKQFAKLPGQTTTGTNFVVLHANDTIVPSFLKNDTVVGVYHAMQSPTSGTLSYQAVFQASDNSLLPYYIQGRSNPIRVVSGSIYQVTVDSVLHDSVPQVTPKLEIKLALNQTAAARRDTILANGADTSLNVSTATRGDTLRVVLQVRDRYGNPVMGKDSTSAKKGLYIQLAHVLSARYPGATADPALLGIDTGTGALQSVRLSFDSTGRAVAKVVVSPNSTFSVLAALRAALVDAAGIEFGKAGSVRDSGVVDTTWVRTIQASTGIQWVDTAGRAELAPIDGWVGSWYPVRLKMLKDGIANPYNGSVAISALSPVFFHPALGDTSRVAAATFTGSALSQVLWVRANDSVSRAWIVASGIGSSDSVGNLRFKYPAIRTASFYDADCDGKVDSLVALFTGPVSFRSATGTGSGDTIDARFPNQFLSSSAYGRPARTRSFDSTATFAWDPTTMGAATAGADRIVLGNPLTGGSVAVKIASLVDKTIPVIVRAEDIQSWVAGGAQDSLVVAFSEPIEISNFAVGTSVPFNAWRNGAAVPLAGAKLSQNVARLDSATYSFVFTNPTGLILSGDSIQGVAGSILDLAGNTNAAGCNGPHRLKVDPRFTPLPGWVKDYDGDGNADSVHLAFKDSIGTLPEVVFVRWGTPAETLTITHSQLVAMGIKTTDTAFTVPTHGWVGKTVVVDGDTVYNAPRTVGPWDTAYFNGGIQKATLADKVPPVVIHARLHYGPAPALGVQGYDTLVVNFSESVQGCATGSDPAACLSQAGATSDSAFPSGSRVISASGDRWTLLVPQGSITPFVTKVRGTPSGKGGILSDAITNKAGNAAYVPVQGDPPPPDHGWMMDRNGDGRVDAVLLQFRSTYRGQSLPTYSFEWGNAAGAAVTLTATKSARYADATHSDSTWWIVTLDAPGDFGVTAYPPIFQRMTGLQSSSTPYRFWVYDSVGPVLVPPATLLPSKDSAGSDTLIVQPSEAVANPTGSILLEFKRGGRTIAQGQVVFVSATPQGNGTWKVLLGPGAYRPNPGDSVRLSTSGSVHDTTRSANVPDAHHPWVVLTGALRVPYSAYYEDATKDGRIDQVVLKFAAPPVVGSVIRVADPAGSGQTRDYVVPASDSNATDITFRFASNPWGQNVTSWTNTNLGSITAPAGIDTGAVKTGRFPILDRVEPVIVSAVMHYTNDTALSDTLVIKLSEDVRIDSTRLRAFLESKRAGTSSDTGASTLAKYFKYDPTSHTLTLYLRPIPATPDTVNPAVGDSVRLTDLVKDLLGNEPGAVAKWTEVTGNRRVFPPIPTLSNPKLIPENPVYGSKVGDGSGKLGLVMRPSLPGNDGYWNVDDPNSGSMTSTGSAYKPGTKDYSTIGKRGTVFFVQTNVPVKLTVYIYDLVGSYVNSQEENITQEMLDAANAQMQKNGQGSKLGKVDIGMLWEGQDKEGRLVGSGIYLARLIAYRDPTPEEKAVGQTGSLMYNHLAKVGVYLPGK